MEVPHHPAGLSAEEIRGMVGDSPLMLEIGCHDGSDTARFFKAMPGLRHIYCFEPDPRPRERFCRLLGNTIPRDRCSLIPVAISDADGPAVFWQSDGQPPSKPTDGEWPPEMAAHWDASGSLLKPTDHLIYSPWVKFPSQIAVDAVRLDTWLLCNPDVGTIDFIWADVQGAEAKIILGAPRALAQTRYLYTEFYDKPLYQGQPNLLGICTLLSGWTLLGNYRENALFRNDHFA